MNRYCDPPDELLAQFGVYLDERQEDYEEQKERTMGPLRGQSRYVLPSSVLIEVLIILSLGIQFN